MGSLNSSATLEVDYDDNQRVLVSIIEVGFIISALILFIAQNKIEYDTRAELFKQYNFQDLEKSLTFKRLLMSLTIFTTLMKIPSGCLKSILRVMVPLNYLLYMSLLILSHLAILDPSYRTVGDVVYLIAAVLIVFTFGAPLMKHLLIYMHVQFK